MKQPVGLIALILFVAGVSFVLSAQDQKSKRPINTATVNDAADVPAPTNGKIDLKPDKTEKPSPKKSPRKAGHRLHR